MYVQSLIIKIFPAVSSFLFLWFFFFAFFLFSTYYTLFTTSYHSPPSSPHPLRPWVACIASGPPQSFVGRRYKMAAKDGGLVFEETSEFKNPEEHFLPPGWEIRTMDDGRIYYAKWVFSRSLIRDFNLVLWKVLWGICSKTFLSGSRMQVPV